MATRRRSTGTAEARATDAGTAGSLKPREKHVNCGQIGPYELPEQVSSPPRPRSYTAVLSSEKDYMNLPETCNRSAEVELAAPVTDLATRRIMRRDPSAPRLKCVSSGYLGDGCSCSTTIPTGVVTDAWAAQQRAGVRGDRLFHFTWRGEVWLAFGRRNGRVRGVYCPTHSAERDRRAPINDSSKEGARANVAMTG
jgi:hypothetical protein